MTLIFVKKNRALNWDAYLNRCVLNWEIIVLQKHISIWYLVILALDKRFAKVIQLYKFVLSLDLLGIDMYVNSSIVDEGALVKSLKVDLFWLRKECSTRQSQFFLPIGLASPSIALGN